MKVNHRGGVFYWFVDDDPTSYLHMSGSNMNKDDYIIYVLSIPQRPSQNATKPTREISVEHRQRYSMTSPT